MAFSLKATNFSFLSFFRSFLPEPGNVPSYRQVSFSRWTADARLRHAANIPPWNVFPFSTPRKFVTVHGDWTKQWKYFVTTISVRYSLNFAKKIEIIRIVEVRDLLEPSEISPLCYEHECLRLRRNHRHRTLRHYFHRQCFIDTRFARQQFLSTTISADDSIIRQRYWPMTLLWYCSSLFF